MEIKEQIEAMAENVKSLIADKEDQVKALEEAKEVATKSATEIAEAKTKGEALEAELKELKEQLEVMEAKANRPVTAMESKMEQKQEIKEALVKYFTSNEKDMQAYAKAMSVGSAADGGNLIPENFHADILELLKDFSPIRQLAGVRKVKDTNYVRPVRVTGAGSNTNTENGTVNGTSTPTFTQISGKYGKIEAYPAVSQEFLHDNPFDTIGMLADTIAEEFIEKECSLLISGTGVNEPVGILSSDYIEAVESAKPDATRAYGKYQVIKTENAGSLVWEDIVKAIGEFRTGYLRNFTILVNRKTLTEMRTWKDAEGRPLFLQSITAASPSTFMGYPVVVCDDLGDHDVSDDYAVLMGDFKRGFEVLDVQDFNMIADPYTVPGSVKYYSFKRLGSLAVDTQAIKAIQIASA